MNPTYTTQPIEQATYEATKTMLADPLGRGSLWYGLVAVTEASMIKAALDTTNGNQTEAAELLGLNRATLRSRVERYGLREYGRVAA